MKGSEMPIRKIRIPFPGDRSRPRSGKFRILPLLIFAGFTVIYLLSNQETVPITGRTQIVDISREQEASLGLHSYREILRSSKVIQSGADFERIKKIGTRLAKVIDGPAFDWEFNLIDSPEANAFCLPGGKVAVYSGILPIANNEDGLAIILGHEIAHAVARHGAERMAQEHLKRLGTVALGMSVQDMDPGTQQMVMGAFGLGARYGLMLPYSRAHESEADYMGLLFAARACFNPEEAPLVWQRMQTADRSVPPEFLSTHPDPSTRINQFQVWMDAAKQEYEKYCGGQSLQ